MADFDVTLEVAGIVFHATPQPDGFGFYYTGLDDWYGVPDSKTDINERAQADGAHGIAYEYRKSAAISFNALYSGNGRVDMLTQQNRLTGAFGVGRMVSATYTDELGPSSRMVSIRSAKPADTHGAEVVAFAIDMLAPDPLRYGPTVLYTTGPPKQGGGLIFPIGTTEPPPSYGFAVVDLFAVDTGVAVA